MGNSTPTGETAVVRVGAVVIRDPNRVFSRPWVTLFRYPGLLDLTRCAKASLIDLTLNAARKEDILIASASDVRLPPSTTYRAIDELHEAGLVLKRWGRIYINPEVAYVGPLSRHTQAIEQWNTMLGGEE